MASLDETESFRYGSADNFGTFKADPHFFLARLITKKILDVF